jgi:hypothetical protein
MNMSKIHSSDSQKEDLLNLNDESELSTELLSEGVSEKHFVKSSSWTNGIEEINQKSKCDSLSRNKE